jgi:signal transduction histidine kinase
MSAPPSIRARLATALTVWSLVWGVSVGAAVWLSATREVDELLDDALQSSAELLGVLAAGPQGGHLPAGDSAQQTGSTVERFAWQVVGRDGRLESRSPRAPAQPWHTTPSAGFGDAEGWRLYGLPLGSDGRMLYAAQTRGERQEARAEVATGAVLAALAVGLLGYVWLRSRVGAELRPLQSLSDRLAQWDVGSPGSSVTPALGPPERSELQPVHDALEALTARLMARIASERAFSAHAAHALRTPLAGIDTQLAVAMRECPAPLQERLQRVRGAASRLQGVVVALLGLFRAGAEAQQRMSIDVAQLLSRLPAPALQVHVEPGARIEGDADLLAAALLNLIDNAHRHGASGVWVATPSPHTLRVRDDGPGVTPLRRQHLQHALDMQATEGVTGLGLMLADRVARAHGGRLRLQEADQGFEVEMELTGDDRMAWFKG